MAVEEREWGWCVEGDVEFQLSAAAPAVQFARGSFFGAKLTHVTCA